MATDPTQWTEFSAAMVGAAAALAGLIFVAISLNLGRIVSVPGLTGRAGEAILTFGLALVSCALVLVPGASATSLGIEWTVLALAFGLASVSLYVRSARAYVRLRAVFVARAVLHLGIASLLLLTGVTTLTDSVGGIYWLVPAALGAIAVGIVDAWVLLVEIVR